MRLHISLWIYWVYIGPALRVIRTHRGVSQKDLAAIMTKTQEGSGGTVYPSYISEIERGGRVSYKRLGLIARCLGCRPSQVIALAEFLAEQSDKTEDEVNQSLREETSRLLGREVS